jgi:hypothetical protein
MGKVRIVSPTALIRAIRIRGGSEEVSDIADESPFCLAAARGPYVSTAFDVSAFQQNKPGGHTVNEGQIVDGVFLAEPPLA